MEIGKQWKGGWRSLREVEWRKNACVKYGRKKKLSREPRYVQFHDSFVTALTITGTKSVYQVGETSGIRCSTEVPVQSIQWLDGSSGVVRQGTSVQELVLDLTIADSHSNSRYTCRVSQGTFIGERVITIITGGKSFKQWWLLLLTFMYSM